MKVECLWTPKYEEKGLIIRSRKNEMHSVSFSPYDFSRARRLYEAEGIDPFNNHEVFRGIVYSILNLPPPKSVPGLSSSSRLTALKTT